MINTFKVTNVMRGSINTKTVYVTLQAADGTKIELNLPDMQRCTFGIDQEYCIEINPAVSLTPKLEMVK